MNNICFSHIDCGGCGQKSADMATAKEDAQRLEEKMEAQWLTEGHAMTTGIY
jgi:hypothetical protein